VQSYPLTRATFLEYAIARSNDNPFVHVDDTTIERWVAWASATIQSAMADRIEVPLLEWDECLEGHAVMLAWRPLMTARGYKKDAGRDSEIAEAAKQALDYCARLRAKQENPQFVDSSSGGIGTRDTIVFTSNTSSEWWRANGACRRGC
jgi:phage gp36-like protein